MKTMRWPQILMFHNSYTATHCAMLPFLSPSPNPCHRLLSFTLGFRFLLTKGLVSPHSDVSEIPGISTPEVLVVQLNRFAVPKTKDGKHKLVGGVLKEVKINDDVPIPEYLDLNPFCEGEKVALYRLDGIVLHKGEQTTSGHYVAGVRDVSGDGFFLVNDSVVKAANFKALESGYPTDHGDPYVLIYSKQ